MQFVGTYPGGDPADDCSNREEGAHEEGEHPPPDQTDDQSGDEGGEPGHHHADLVADPDLVLRYVPVDTTTSSHNNWSNEWWSDMEFYFFCFKPRVPVSQRTPNNYIIVL